MSAHITIDTPEGIALYRVLALRSALRLEVNHGLRASRHALVPIAKGYGYTGRTKAGALAFVNEMLSEFDARTV